MRRACTLFAAVLLISAGCRPTETSPIQTALPQQTTPTQPAGPPLITVTPAAAEELRTAAADFAPGQRWWVRLTAKPGGCTGFQSKLDLDVLGVKATDREAVCDGVRILYMADKEFAVQGAVIDFVNTTKERGFTVKYPNQTEENRQRTAAWVQKELGLVRTPDKSEDE